MMNIPRLEDLGTELKFPTLDTSVSGAWAPLLMEPMVGSGERLCVGVAAFNSDRVVVSKAPGLSRLECLYDDDAEFLLWIIDQAIEDIESLYRNGGRRTVHPWTPPLEGFYLGDPIESAGASLEAIAEAGLMLSASLVQRPERAASRQDSILPSGELTSKIRDYVAFRQPGLAHYFRAERIIGENAKSVQFGFAGHRLAANFASLNPSSPGLALNDAKSKLLDLESLRYRFGEQDKLFTRKINKYMMGILVPPTDSLTTNARLSVERMVSQLQLLSDANKIQLLTHDEPAPLAEAVIELENVA